MTADARTATQHRQQRDQTTHPVVCICQIISLFHAQIVENLAIDGPGFERIVKWSKPARKPAGCTGRHSRMIWTWPWDTVTQDTLGNSRDYKQDCARSVKPRLILPTRETERHEMVCPYEEGLWCGTGRRIQATFRTTLHRTNVAPWRRLLQ